VWWKILKAKLTRPYSGRGTTELRGEGCWRHVGPKGRWISQCRSFFGCSGYLCQDDVVLRRLNQGANGPNRPSPNPSICTRHLDSPCIPSGHTCVSVFYGVQQQLGTVTREAWSNAPSQRRWGPIWPYPITLDDMVLSMKPTLSTHMICIYSTRLDSVFFSLE